MLRDGGKALPPPPTKICQTYLTSMKLGTFIPHPKKILKMYKDMTHTLTFADISIFYQKSATFVLVRNTDKDWILMLSCYFFNLVLLFKGCSNKNGCNFDDTSKIGYSRPS